MTPRDLALKVLSRLDSKQNYSGGYLDDLFRENPSLDGRDRAFISQLVQGVLRWRLRLDWIIERFSSTPLKKIDNPILNILRLSLFQIFFLDRVPESAAVNEAVNQTKSNRRLRHLSPFVNGILRNICRKKDSIELPPVNSVEYLSVYHSYPRWLVDKWIRELGRESAEELLSAQNRVPCLNIRTNTLKISREGLIKELAGEGVEGIPSAFSPEGIILEDFRGRVGDLKSFGKGLFQVQNQAAQIVSHILGPRPEDTVLDICAGLGGKSTHMAELKGGRGKILALDLSLGKLISLGRNALRLGISNIIPVVADASKSLPSLFRGGFDRVMVDAPCSGLGVISKHPDSKWNRSVKDIKRLALLQKRILREAASVTRKGGRILYVTCSISREENEEVVEDFLSDNKEFSLGKIKEHIPVWGFDLVDEKGFYRTFPHRHGMDAFFGALIIKN